jgi:hypothetical protein
MHRSGTSALTRVFSLLGADLPKNMLGANPTNEAGHWESLDLMAVHDELLATAGSRWDDWRAFNPDWIHSGVADGFREKLLGVVRNDFAGSALFVVKDPRICRFVPLWLEVLERFGAEPRIVIPVRNPLEVAASHKRRDSFPPAKSYLLWLRHVLDAEQATRHVPRAMVSYGDLLADWRHLIAAVAAKTGLHWPRRSDRAELDIDRFLADPLRHHTADDAELSARGEIADWVKQTYRVLRDMADNGETADHFSRLDRIHAEFDQACAAFGLVLEAEAEQNAEQLLSAQSQIAARDAEIERLSVGLTQAQAAANDATAAAAASQSRAAALTADLETARAAAAEDERRIAEIAAQLGAATSASEQLTRQRGELAAALEAEKAVAAKVQADLAAALEAEQATVAASQAQVAALAQELEASRHALAGHQAAAAKLQADRDAAQALAERRKAELDQLGGELRAAQALVKDRDGAVERLLRDLDAARGYLRDSQTEVQRLAGERDGMRAEVSRAKAGQERLAAASAAASRELERARAEMAKLAAERDGLRQAASQLPALQAQLAALKEALAGAREDSDRSELRLNELSAQLQAATALTDRVRELEARLAETGGEKDRIAGELARAAAALRRAEQNAAERVAVLEAARATALAESETRAQAQLRALRDQLIDAEAGLAKAKSGHNGTAWTPPFSLSRRIARRLATSGLFDAKWYLREYPDVATSGRPPAEHYVEEGCLRGYRPNPFFDTRWYLERYEDVRRAGINPALHYLLHGAAEGRDPGPDFHTRYYLEANPDVRGNGMNPLAHYLRHGRHEGRLPAPRR